MIRFMPWFRKQTQRDQLALVGLAAALLLYLLFQGLLRPLQLRLDVATQRVANAEQSLAAVVAMAGRLAQYRASAAADSGSFAGLASLLDGSSAALGLQLASLEPSNDGTSAAVRLDQVALEPLLRWLQRLQTEGVRVESLDLIPGQQPGQVTAVLRLGAPRAGAN
ncbi:MAG: type II secretion system protein GspM [Pseudohongiellaceae bacterium]|jgi:general secretion pathway protein M